PRLPAAQRRADPLHLGLRHPRTRGPLRPSRHDGVSALHRRAERALALAKALTDRRAVTPGRPLRAPAPPRPGRGRSRSLRLGRRSSANHLVPQSLAGRPVRLARAGVATPPALWLLVGGHDDGVSWTESPPEDGKMD